MSEETTIDYTGRLVNASNGEEDDLLGLEKDGETSFLAELIADDMREHGRYLSVQYWTSDEPLTKEQATAAFIDLLYGTGKAAYGMAYSDVTGYLWTDEDLMVGGHDLLEELKSHIGKYVILEIGYAKSPPPSKE